MSLWLSLQTLEAVFLICRTLNYMAMILYRNDYRKLQIDQKQNAVKGKGYDKI